MPKFGQKSRATVEETCKTNTSAKGFQRSSGRIRNIMLFRHLRFISRLIIRGLRVFFGMTARVSFFLLVLLSGLEPDEDGE